MRKLRQQKRHHLTLQRQTQRRKWQMTSLSSLMTESKEKQKKMAEMVTFHNSRVPHSVKKPLTLFKSSTSKSPAFISTISRIVKNGKKPGYNGLPRDCLPGAAQRS